MYIFCDLETTGLDPRSDLILEAAFAIVDDDFDLVDERVFTWPWSVWVERKMDQADEIVVEMHTRNHLMADMHRLTALGNNMSYNFYGGCMEFKIFEWLEEHELEVGTCELAGSGIHFDRSFLKEYMPQLEEWFHYRNWDVSTLKRAAAKWAPEWFKSQSLFAVESEHRAQSDVQLAYEHSKLIRDLFTEQEKSWGSQLRLGL